ncbi:hypothetical protein QYE76_026203 [Lolium multiflorum]|uniref:Retrotransposon gag domain-containing protein n=1 Tax=Lolium multiflorum TaxID=4521 RepID=A0AAD8RH67_LOLMU|nr:hypothetical protein QYE76_026203 [Lolium multiflorum]
MENYSLLMGDSSVDEDGGGVDGGAFRGHFPVPAACRNRDFCPRIGVSRWRRLWKVFSGFVERDKTLLDTSCSGSFTRNKEEFKRDLLDRIQENTEGWENDKDRESAYIEKTPFPAKMKEYSVISSAVNKSEKKPIEPEEQIKVEPAVAIIKDLVTENVEDGHIIFCEDASNIVSHPNKSRKASVPMLSVRIGDHCYYGLCDIGASISAIPYELYTEIMHEIGSCELEDIDVVIRLANRETISPIGIVRDVEVLCDCKKEKIVTKFAGESYEFNFSKFAKTPYKAELPNNDFRVEQCASIALAPNNPLQQHLENSESEVFREERNELDEIFLRQPILKHDLPVEDLGIAMDEVRKKLFSISLSGKAAHWYKLLDNGDSLEWNDIVPRFYSKFYPPSEIHKDRNRIYNFWPHEGESIAQAWGRLKSLMLKCPIHELPGNIIIDNFYARLSFQDKTLLDTSCSGSFTRNKEEFKRDLLNRIQENTEGWENDKDRESGINYDYKCIEAFMDTDKFHNMSATYGLDSQVAANLYKAFASHYELPKKNFDKYHEPYKDKIDSSINKCVVVETVDHVIPEAYIEKTPFPAKMKEYSVINSAVHKSEKKPIEPEEQIKVEPAVAIVKDLVTENVEDGHIIFCEDASNIVSHPNKSKQASVPMLSVRIGDHCYYGLCDIGASISAIPYELYTEIMHEIGSCELEDIDVVIRLANRETISPIGIVRDVEVLCDCKKEKILTKFAGESYEFNFSKFTKTPYKIDSPNSDFKVEQCASIALAPSNPLQQHLENSESEVFREERDELDEIFLRQPILKHDLPVEDLGTTPPPKEDPVFDLKPLPDNLKYAHIDDKKIYPVIISSKLSEFEEERLLEILKKHRGAIGYTLDDLKGISPSICQHAINMEDDAKPVVEHQRRLIPKMKDVVRNEVLRLLEAGIIYPIADSRWVSPVHCVPKKGGMTVVPNDNDELIPQRVVVGIYFQSRSTMASNNKGKGLSDEDIQDPEWKEVDESVKEEDEEEVEEDSRAYPRATIASIEVVDNPFSANKSARIRTGGRVPRHYLAPKTSSSGTYHPFRNLIYNNQIERTPKAALPSNWDIDRSNTAGRTKPEAEGWGNNSKNWDSPSDILLNRVEHNSEMIRNLMYKIDELQELVGNSSPPSPKE